MLGTAFIAVAALLAGMANPVMAQATPQSSTTHSVAESPPEGVQAQYVTQWFRNEATGFCLSAEGVGEYERVVVGDCDYDGGSPYDEWQVTRWNDGTRELRSNGLAWLCITSASTGAGDNVVLDTCDASRWQSWFVDQWNDGTIRFRNQQTGLCLTHYLGNYFIVTQEACNTSENQSWE